MFVPLVWKKFRHKPQPNIKGQAQDDERKHRSFFGKLKKYRARARLELGSLSRG